MSCQAVIDAKIGWLKSRMMPSRTSRARTRAVDNLWTTRRESVQSLVDNSIDLTGMLPSSSASERLRACSSLKRLAVVGILCLFIGSLSLQMQPAQASNADHYKLYAHSRIINDQQYICLKHIIYKESRWNPKAKNGSHYGLGQMRSTHYRELDPYRQIDATIKYIKHRYGSMCKAWEFHQKKGHY
jgi:hypothetical protein